MKRISLHIDFLSCCLLLLVCMPAFSQQGIDELRQQFAAYELQAPQEKLFVHTDKSFYITGETIWFKLYDVDAGSHKYSDLSKVAYVEILNQDAKPVLQAKIGLDANNGAGNGSFILPAHLASGTYLLRAYTQWMRNFDEAYFFQKSLTIVNTSRKPDWQALEKREAYKLQFFPEGGNLVYGLQSKIGFKITDQYGKGVDGAGAIVSQRNDTVARFQSLKFGIGSFLFQPQAGSEYKAVVRLNDGKIITALLPQVYREGFVMNATEVDNERLKVTVASTNNQASPVYFLAHTRQEMKLALVQNTINGKTEWTIRKDQLGEGVSHLTIFNQNREPVCERLYFRRPSAKMKIEVRGNAPQYATRSEVLLHLQTHNEKAEPVQADLSVSVFLLDSLQAHDAHTIDTYLWLTSELNGVVESPSYYYGESSNASTEVNTAIDNLLLTHGWRRFRWEDIKRKPAFSFLPEYEGLTVSAKVINKQTGLPARGVVSYLSVADENFQVSNAVSNEKGEANFVVGNVFGPNELVAQTDSNSSLYRIDLSDPFAPKRDSLLLPRFSLPAKWKDELNAHHLNARLENSFQPLHVQQFLPPATTDTSVFFGNPDKRYYLDEFTRFPTMEEVMREFVDAVRIKKDRTGFSYEVMNMPAKLFFNSAPLVLLDGVPVFDVNKIVAFDPLKIKKIDVINRKYFWGNLVNSGIVSYTTYEGDLAGFELDPNAIIMEFQGLQLQREFYQPNYSIPANKNSRVPDTRNVLLWKSSVLQDENGKSTTRLFTSDVPGEYVIVVQGLSSKGVPGSAAVVMVVKD